MRRRGPTKSTYSNKIHRCFIGIIVSRWFCSRTASRNCLCDFLVLEDCNRAEICHSLCWK